ncbi:hypothetical protein EDB85DRAFT_1896696 [Lactarius pseudohatsudake]|nr:hypothetical protein EDB85DRAFT_1896696 [Lactarius pseudohatsudake]
MESHDIARGIGGAGGKLAVMVLCGVGMSWQRRGLARDIGRAGGKLVVMVLCGVLGVAWGLACDVRVVWWWDWWVAGWHGGRATQSGWWHGGSIGVVDKACMRACNRIRAMGGLWGWSKCSKNVMDKRREEKEKPPLRRDGCIKPPLNTFFQQAMLSTSLFSHFTPPTCPPTSTPHPAPPNSPSPLQALPSPIPLAVMKTPDDTLGFILVHQDFSSFPHPPCHPQHGMQDPVTADLSHVTPTANLPPHCPQHLTLSPTTANPPCCPSTACKTLPPPTHPHTTPIRHTRPRHHRLPCHPNTACKTPPCRLNTAHKTLPPPQHHAQDPTTAHPPCHPQHSTQDLTTAAASTLRVRPHTTPNTTQGHHCQPATSPPNTTCKTPPPPTHPHTTPDTMQDHDRQLATSPPIPHSRPRHP